MDPGRDSNGTPAKAPIVRPRAIAYGVAVAATAAATLVRSLLDPLLGNMAQFVTFFAAVVLAGIMGGGGPALAATIQCALAVKFFFIPPRWTFQVDSVAHAVALGLFVGCALFIAWIAGRMHEARQAALRELSVRRRAERALQESEQRVRRKLESILSPEGDIGALELSDLIDVPAVQSLMDNFYQLAGVPMGMLDLEGRVLVGVGWQPICTDFHRAHPESCRHCVESDTQLSAGVPAGQCRLYKCKNGMWDVATPILIGERQVGNFFTGQFFFEDETLDRDHFRAQARRYGFDERRYLAALEAVPRLSRQTVDTSMAFFLKFANLLSKVGYGNVSLARLLAQLDSSLASLRESQDRLNRAQEIAHLGSWELDLGSNRLTWSDEVYRLFGLRPQEFAATYEAFLEAVHPDDREAVNTAYSGSIREGRDSYEVEHRIVRKATGEVRFVHEKCEHTRDASGRIIRSIGMVHDITERKSAEQALRQTAEELARSNRDLEQFAYVSSHDLQEPLRMVTGFMQLLEQRYAGKLDATANRYIGYAVDGARRMQGLIEDLLTYSRVGTKAREPVPTDAGILLRRAVANLSVSIAESRAEVTFGPMPTVRADGPQLVQVFQNLVANAIKFHGDREPVVHVEARRDGDSWIFSVQDNGIGIAPEFREKVFLIFQRLHTRDKYAGTGIGLAICKKIIDSHGGRIWAESAPGQGSAFCFTLPA